MAGLICNSCETPVEPGQSMCPGCGALLTLPGQVRELTEEPDSEGPGDGAAEPAGGGDGAVPAGTAEQPERCATPDCSHPAMRGQRYCRRCYLNRPRGRDFEVLLPDGTVAVIPDGESVGVGRGQEFCPFAAHLAGMRFVNQRHAFLRSEAGSLTVRDLDSLNGTRVNTVRIDPQSETQVVPGDVIRLGGQVDLVVR